MTGLAWDSVSATRDLIEVPDAFRTEVERVDHTVRMYSDRTSLTDVRHIYSLQASPEILRTGTGEPSLVWDWRWVEHSRRIVAWAACDVDGPALVGPLGYLLLAERALEERDALLASGVLFALRRFGSPTFQDVDQVLGAGPDHDASMGLASRVELMALLHEIAHLLVDREDEWIRKEEQSLTTFIDQLDQTAFGDLNPKLPPALLEMTCDAFALGSSEENLVESFLAGDRTLVRQIVFGMEIYFGMIDFLETLRRTFADRRWHFAEDREANLALSRMRHKIVLGYVVERSCHRLGQCLEPQAAAPAVADFIAAAHEGIQMAAMARFFLLKVVSQMEYERFRHMLRSWGSESEVAGLDSIEILSQLVDWPLDTQ